MKFLFSIFFIGFGFSVPAQKTYEDSITLYVKNYVDSHGVVKGNDKKKLGFFKIDKRYKVVASFEKKENMPWFLMATSGQVKKQYRVYGVVHFKLKGSLLQLSLYQSQSLILNEQYKNLLFLPFTDATTGNETYDGGRYIDLDMADISNNEIIIDFNKAYNPYCAYVNGVYNCPVPPKENHLNIAIKAGEKVYGKH